MRSPTGFNMIMFFLVYLIVQGAIIALLSGVFK